MNWKKVGIHALAWIGAFFINIILIRGYSFHIDWENMLVDWGLYLVVFYANYLFLIPRLLFPRRVVWYILSALTVLTLSFFALKYHAVYSALKHTRHLSEQLIGYDDVKDSFEQKDRARERRDRMQARGRNFPKSPDELPPGPPPGELPSPDSVPEKPSVESGQPDELSFTEREEEYGQLRREYERFRAYARGISREGYNPFSRFNMQFIYALVFSYLISIVVAYMEKSSEAEKRRREMEKEKVSAELAYLKQQINPHFLFNTLNAIYSYTIGVSEPASEAVLKLSSILRYMLYETNRERVPLVDELTVIDDYIDLQRMRMTDKTEVKVTVNGDTRAHQIEPMLLIPIIENAFKFGADSVDPSFIHIQIDVSGGDFTFVVANKIVKRGSGDKNSSGIGIKNIKRRLELIYGSANYRLKSGEKEGIFSVTLYLNLKK